MILITGATGLVGSHLLYRLVSAGKHVRITNRNAQRLESIRKVFGYYGAEAITDRVEVAEGDLLDPAFCMEAMKGIREVYHCAAMVSFQPSERDQLIELNTAMTTTVVNGCLASGVRKLVFVSSTAATGTASKPGEMITEKNPWNFGDKSTGYSVSKHLSEMEVWRGAAEGLQIAIVNPAIIIGPGNWGESSTAIIGRCYKGLRFYPTGVNAIVDVRDVTSVMVELMESDISEERFILAGENLSFQSLFEQITASLGRPSPHIRASRWMGELVWRAEWIRSKISGKPPVITQESARTSMAHHLYSSEKIRNALGFTFRPAADTIHWTCEHYLKDLKRSSV